MTRTDLEAHFTFDPITKDATETVGAIRSAGQKLALMVFDKAPDGDLKQASILHIIEAVTIANAAVANANPIPPPAGFDVDPTPKS